MKFEENRSKILKIESRNKMVTNRRTDTQHKIFNGGYTIIPRTLSGGV